MSSDSAPWRRQSSQISGNGASSPSPGPPPGAPPPPPPYSTGNLPSVRIPTEMACRKEPPAAIQNAMMTKDKKPFTYTPGGLDLNEIKSPRMAKRLSRNAHLEDSCSPAVAAASQPHPAAAPHQLPPQALAAMQPQIAVAVLPQGVALPKPLNSPPSHPQASVSSPPIQSNSAPPPPPLMPPNGGQTRNNFNDGIPSGNFGVPDPPTMPSDVGPPPPPPLPGNGTTGGPPPPPPPPLPADGSLPVKPVASDPSASYSSDTLRRNQPRPDYIADIANHAHTLKRVNQPPRSQAEQQGQNFPQVQLRQTGFHHKKQNSDDNGPEEVEAVDDRPTRFKTPSPPKSIPDGATPPVEQLNRMQAAPPAAAPLQQSPRPFFQQPMQQPRPASQTPTPSPSVNQPRPFRPQMSPVSPPSLESQNRRFSPPRSSPPTPQPDIVYKQQFQSPPTPQADNFNRQQFQSPPTPQADSFSRQQFQSPPTPQADSFNRQQFQSPPTPQADSFNRQLYQSPTTPQPNQPKMFRPPSTPATPEAMGPIYNQTRKSPPREFVTVFQPQIFQDIGQAAEKFQARSKLPGLKMPDESDQSPRGTPPSSAGLRQAPAPWMSAQRQSKEVPPWASREEAGQPPRAVPFPTLHISARIVPMNMESYQEPEAKPASQSQQQGRVRIIPIRLEGSDDVIKPQASQQNKYDHKDNTQMYQQQPPTMHNQMPQSPNQYVSQSPNPYVPQSLNQFASQSPNPYVPQSPNPYVSQSPNPYVSQSPNPYVSQSPNPYAQQLNQHQAAAQPPRGWSPVKSPPVQSKSFRVLQKITGSDQEAFGENAKSDGEVLFLVNRVQPRRDSPSFREMTSPPVYTMPPNYPPPPQSYYSPRSPTYDTNAGRQVDGAGNNWVWDANSQTFVTSDTPPPGSGNAPHWDAADRPDAAAAPYPDPYDYWNYPPQSEEEQRQFWEHYGQMCAYLAHLNAAACRYSPFPCPPLPYPSDSDECGYSSNDEMTYYGQMFKQRAQSYWQNAKQKSSSQSPGSTPRASADDTTDEKEEDSDSTDTETDNVEKESEGKDGTESADASEDESSRSCTEIPHQLSIIFEETEPPSEADSKVSVQPSDDEDSSATLENDSRKASADNTSSDTENSIVRVRLPLKLKFTQSEGDCHHVTTVIVGDSEVQSSPEIRSEEVWSPVPEASATTTGQKSDWTVRQEEQRDASPSPDVTVTINLNRKKPSPVVQDEVKPPELADKVEGNSNESTIDFWQELKESSDDDAPAKPSNTEVEDNLQRWDLSSSEASILTVKRASSDDSDESTSEEESDNDSDLDETEVKQINEVDDSKSTQSASGGSKTVIPTITTSRSSDEESGSESESECSEDERYHKDSASSISPSKSGSVRRNIDLVMFKSSIDNDKSREGDESDNDDTSDSDSSCANLSSALDGQNEEAGEERLNERSVEESEEDDSGVTSDLSRHISETDTDAEGGTSELRKLTRYQRAATHSRLFKLLQGECDGSDDEEDQAVVASRERLTLPLVGALSKSNMSSDQESSSSGINSPMSPAVNERLVKELVQSLLSRKKGRHFRKLPLDKLYAAAARILQEDMDYDTESTSDDSNMFLSPCEDPRVDRPPGYQLPNPENYGENYYNYCDYYDSWAEAAYYSSQPGIDIVPSKAFRALQTTTRNERDQLDLSVPVRCPKLSLPKTAPKQSRPAPPET